MYFRSSISLLRFVFLLLAGLGLSGCPGSWSKKQEVDPLPGVIRFDYSKIRIAQQYSGRAYVHIRLYLLHGPALADPNLAGLESLAIETALGAGAGNRNGAAFAAKIEALGGQFGHFTNSEYSVLTLNCLPSKAQETWAVFSSALLEPRFEEAEFARIKSQRLAKLAGEAEQPDLRVLHLANAQAFAGTAAAIPILGTTESLSAITLAQVRKYFTKSLMHKCRMVMVTAGPLDGEGVTDMLFDNLDMLAVGDCKVGAELPEEIVAKPLVAEQADLPLQYVVGTLHSVGGSAERAQIASFLVEIIQQRLAQRFSGPSSLACRPEIRFIPQQNGYAQIRINSPRALACTELLLSELRKLRQEGLSLASWNQMRPSLLNRNRMQRETAVGIANILGECLISGTWENCGTDLELVKKLSLKKINNLLQLQLGGISLAYIGDTTRMDRKTLSNF